MDTDIRARQETGTGRAAGIALMLASSLSSQTGAAVGATAFGVIGPVGVVAVRQWVAGAVLRRR